MQPKIGYGCKKDNKYKNSLGFYTRIVSNILEISKERVLSIRDFKTKSNLHFMCEDFLCVQYGHKLFEKNVIILIDLIVHKIVKEFEYFAFVQKTIHLHIRY